MNSRRLRIWTIVMPAAALSVSAGIVSWEYAWRSHLASRLVEVEKEYARLDSLRPKAERVPMDASDAHHHDGHDEHDEHGN